MTYSLEFDARALKEWHKQGDTVRQQLKTKLAEILLNLRIKANRLHADRAAQQWQSVAVPVHDHEGGLCGGG